MYQLFATDHSAVACKSGNCKSCGERHNSLLHLKSRQGETSQSSSTISESSKGESNINSITACTSISYNKSILLSTALIYVLDRHGRRHKCRALLDNESQVNLI